MKISQGTAGVGAPTSEERTNNFLRHSTTSAFTDMTEQNGYATEEREFKQACVGSVSGGVGGGGRLLETHGTIQWK